MKSLKSPVVWSTGSSHVIGCENVVFKTKKKQHGTVYLCYFWIITYLLKMSMKSGLVSYINKNEQIKQAFYISIFQPLSWETCMNLGLNLG